MRDALVEECESELLADSVGEVATELEDGLQNLLEATFVTYSVSRQLSTRVHEVGLKLTIGQVNALQFR